MAKTETFEPFFLSYLANGAEILPNFAAENR